MASTQRDVELVIRAKDEATKALGAITDSLNALADQQGRVGESANSTGTMLDKFGQSIATMNRQVEGLGALGTAVTQMNKAGEAIERLDQQLTSSNERLDSSRTKYEAVGAAIETLRARSTDIKEALGSEGAALKQTQVEAAALESVMGKLAEALPRTASQVKKLTAASEQEKQAYRDNRDLMIQYIEQQLKLEASVAQQVSTIKSLTTEQKQANAELAANEKVYGRLAQQIERQDTAQQQALVRVTEAKEAYAEMSVAAERAASVLGGVALTSESIAAATKSATETVRQLNAELAKQPAVAPSSAAAAVNPRDELIAAKEAVAQSEAVWKQATVAVAALNNEIHQSAAPSQEQAAKFLLAKQAATEAKNAYEQNVAVLGDVRSRVRQYIEDTQEQRSATLGAAEAERQMAAAREALVNSNIYAHLEEEDGILRKLRTEWQELSAAIRQNFVAQAEASRAQKEHVGSSNAAADALSNLKSQVVGLASAYLGLMGAMQAVKGIIDTYRTLEQTQAQLVASHGGDQKAAASDMIFLRGEAERLGLSLKDVAEQYGKLSVATSSNNVSQRTTRELFSAVAESARVAGLDSEHTSNVLYGFVRMIDTGKVSARDFRSVLMSVPGAQKAMDEALNRTTGELGVTTAEFRKLEKSTAGITVTDQLMRNWAEIMSEQMGNKLPYALHTFNAEWGRFQTNLQESEDTIGKSGFIDALAFQLRRLNEFMKSDEGQKYFQELGHSLTTIVNVVASVVSHVGLLKTAFELLIAVKVGGFLASLIPLAINMIASFSEMKFAIEAFAAGAATAMEAVDVAMGGLPLILGAIVFGLAQVFGEAVEGVTALDSALDTHERYMTRMQDGYTQAAGKVDVFRKSLNDLTETQLLSNKQDLSKGLNDTLDDMIARARHAASGPEGYSPYDVGSAKTGQAVKDITEKLRQGKITVVEYRDELLKLKMADDKFAESELFKSLSTSTEQVLKTRTAIRETDEQLKLLHGSTQDVADATDSLGLSMDGLKNGLPTDSLKDFNDALLAIKQNIPELARAAEAQSKLNQALEQYQSAIGAAKGDPGLMAQAAAVHDRAVASILAGASFGDAQDAQRTDAMGVATRYTGGWTPRFRNGGDNSDAAVDAKIAKAAAMLGVSPTQDLTKTALRLGQIAEAMTANEGGKGSLADRNNNPANIRRNGQFVHYATREDGINAAAELIRHKLDSGQVTVQSLIEGLPAKGGSANPTGRYASDGAFVNALLERLGLHHTETSAASFAKVGTNIGDASKAEPGDIVILKGRGNTAGGVGVLKAIGEDGSAIINTARGTRTVGQDRVAAYQRVPDSHALFTDQANAVDQAGEFQQMIKDVIAKNLGNTTAIGKSPVDLAVSEAMARLDKWLNDAKDKAEREGKPFTAGYRPGQREAVETSIRGFFDAKHADEEQKKLAEIQHSWDEIVHGAQRATAEERARQQLQAKGFRFDAAGNPADAATRAAFSTQTNVEKDKDFRASAQDLTGLGGQMSTRVKDLRDAYREGDRDEIKKAKADIIAINKAITDGLPAVIAYFKSMGDEKTVSQLQKVAKQAKDLQDDGLGMFSRKDIKTDISGGMVGTFNALSKGLAGAISGVNGFGRAFRDAKTAFLDFASNYLIKIADMIIQAQIFKLLSSIGGGGLGGVNYGAITSAANNVQVDVPMNHAGGIAGASGMSRSISPAVFANAIRYHSGGIAGLKPNEVATVLERGEEVLKESSPRHIKNIASHAAASSPPPQSIKVVNTIDPGHMLSEALGTTKGERAIINHIRQNSRSINKALQG